MIRVRNTLAMLAFTALFGCAVDLPASTPTTEQVNLQLRATHATKPLIRDLTSSYFDEHPEFNFDMASDSYRDLITELNSGAIDYFVSLHIPANTDLWAAPIARDGIIIIVHPDNPMRDIQTDNLRDIFSGHNKKWENKIDNLDTIIPVTFDDTSDVYREFHHLVMGQQRITSNAQVVPGIDAMLSLVATTPQAIGYIPFSHISNDVQNLAIDGIQPDTSSLSENVYPLRSTIFVIGRDEAQPAYRTFINWVQSTDGQEIVSRQYVSLP